jgi:hypothetical protein
MLLLAQQIKTAGKDSMAGETNFSDSIKLAKKHKRKIEFHQKSAAALQAQLAKIKSMHPQVNSRLALLEALKNNSIEWYSTTEQDKTWIKFTEWFSKERISKTGLEEQELLKDKIEVHLAYAEVHKKQLEKFAT